MNKTFALSPSAELRAPNCKKNESAKLLFIKYLPLGWYAEFLLKIVLQFLLGKISARLNLVVFIVIFLPHFVHFHTFLLDTKKQQSVRDKKLLSSLQN